MRAGEKRVLLVDPPLRANNITVLGVATLKPLLVREGIPADMLSGTHLFPRARENEELRNSLRTHFSQFTFVPALFPSVSPEDCLRAVKQSLLEQFSLQGGWIDRDEVTLADVNVDDGQFRRAILEDIEHSGLCVDRCVARASDPAYDVVGFSCSFETQIPAALAIARRLKAQRPEVAVVFGGSACFGEVADELMRVFPEIDAVCHSEGDLVIVPLVHALRAPVEQRRQLLAAVPGTVWRDAAGAIQRNPSPPLMSALDELPVPDYDDFLAQLAASEYADIQPHLYFETSRGCWWGEKHLCSFCGLNAEGIAFRKKSGERVFNEIRELHERYPDAKRLAATDNILGMEYLQSLMPRLAEWRRTQKRPPRLFFELKANLRRDQIRLLREAGIDNVQPGIEAFNDGVLQLMDKGCTGLGQVQTIKWLTEHGITAPYHLLVQNPQETAEQYREMTELVPFIEHLPAPRLTTMELQRFSPYFTNPAQHGIRNVRARPYYAWAYPVDGINLDRLAYRFDYDHEMFADAELNEARRGFIKRALQWASSWKPDMLTYVDHGDSFVINDQRATFPRRYRVTGLGLRLFRYLDQVRTQAQIDKQFADVAPEVRAALLDSWLRRRWICKDPRGRFLAVVLEDRQRRVRPGQTEAPVLSPPLAAVG